MTRFNKNFIIGLIDSHIIHYPTPITLTYAWSFGSLAGICLVIQMVSGIFLSMHFLGVAGMPRRIPDYPDAFYILQICCII